ncbi:MAG: DUF2007 domain-containing protein [Clostridium sp.]|nr:DUF2007 domain-containing protein [Clostridium sp.]
MANHFSLPPTDLVEENKAQTFDDENDQWEVVTVFDNEIDATIASGALENEGIASMLTNQTFSSVLPVGFNSIGGVRLWVRHADADRALSILRRNDRGDGGPRTNHSDK